MPYDQEIILRVSFELKHGLYFLIRWISFDSFAAFYGIVVNPAIVTVGMTTIISILGKCYIVLRTIRVSIRHVYFCHSPISLSTILIYEKLGEYWDYRLYWKGDKWARLWDRFRNWFRDDRLLNRVWFH